MFIDSSKKDLELIFEYHGLFHSKNKNLDAAACYTLGKSNTGVNINQSIVNDAAKQDHIKTLFPSAIYCVAWPENLKKREMKIEHLRVH